MFPVSDRNPEFSPVQFWKHLCSGSRPVQTARSLLDLGSHRKTDSTEVCPLGQLPNQPVEESRDVSRFESSTLDFPIHRSPKPRGTPDATDAVRRGLPLQTEFPFQM